MIKTFYNNYVEGLSSMHFFIDHQFSVILQWRRNHIEVHAYSTKKISYLPKFFPQKHEIPNPGKGGGGGG